MRELVGSKNTIDQNDRSVVKLQKATFNLNLYIHTYINIHTNTHIQIHKHIYTYKHVHTQIHKTQDFTEYHPKNLKIFEDAARYVFSSNYDTPIAVRAQVPADCIFSVLAEA